MKLSKSPVVVLILKTALLFTVMVNCKSDASGGITGGGVTPDGGVTGVTGEEVVWTCGMHPQVRSDKPGDCPICGMDLIPLESETGRSQDADAPQMVQLTQNEINLARVGTVEIEKKELSQTLRTTGIVEFDERALQTVSARFGGRIERLYVNYQGAVVSGGSPLAEIYSPELAAAQQEYISARASYESLAEGASGQIKDNAKALYDASRDRLKLWGITDRQIDELERTGSPRYTMTVFAPQSGTVTAQHVVEGEYVKTGQPLIEIGNPRRVWIQAVVYEQDISSVKRGQYAEFSIPGNRPETYEGTVTFIAPVLDPVTRSVKVRIQPQSTSSNIKPGMYVDVDIHQPGDEALAVPRDAVIDTGEESIVYIDAGDGMFIAREIKVGPASGEYYPVLSGLSEGEKVVARGAFLIDSETRITGGSSALYGGASEVDDQTPVHQH